MVHPTLSSTEVFRVLSDIKEHYNSSANVDDIYQSYVQKRRVASLLPVIDVEGGETLSPQSSKPIEIALCGSDDDANHVVTKRKRMVSAILFSDSEESRNDCKKRHKATGRTDEFFNTLVFLE